MFVEVPMFSPLIKIFAPINVSLVCPSKTVPVRFVCAKQNLEANNNTKILYIRII